MDIERTARAQDTPQEMGARRQGKLQLSCCCLVSLHFLWGILHTSTVFVQKWILMSQMKLTTALNCVPGWQTRWSGSCRCCRHPRPWLACPPGLGFNGVQIIYYLIFRHIQTAKNCQKIVKNLRQPRRIYTRKSHLRAIEYQSCAVLSVAPSRAFLSSEAVM